MINQSLEHLIFIVGSTFVSIGAVIISAPISIALAIFMNYISPKLRRKSYYNQQWNYLLEYLL